MTGLPGAAVLSTSVEAAGDELWIFILLFLFVELVAAAEVAWMTGSVQMLYS